MTTPRLSFPTLKVLRCLLDSTRYRWGSDLAEATGIGTGTLYPILARLVRAGWLTDEWEYVEPKFLGRPRRRYYRLTDKGRRAAEAALETLR